MQETLGKHRKLYLAVQEYTTRTHTSNIYQLSQLIMSIISYSHLHLVLQLSGGFQMTIILPPHNNLQTATLFTTNSTDKLQGLFNVTFIVICMLFLNHLTCQMILLFLLDTYSFFLMYHYEVFEYMVIFPIISMVFIVWFGTAWRFLGLHVIVELTLHVHCPSVGFDFISYDLKVRFKINFVFHLQLFMLKDCFGIVEVDHSSKKGLK